MAWLKSRPLALMHRSLIKKMAALGPVLWQAGCQMWCQHTIQVRVHALTAPSSHQLPANGLRKAEDGKNIWGTASTWEMWMKLLIFSWLNLLHYGHLWSEPELGSSLPSLDFQKQINKQAFHFRKFSGLWQDLWGTVILSRECKFDEKKCFSSEYSFLVRPEPPGLSSPCSEYLQSVQDLLLKNSPLGGITTCTNFSKQIQRNSNTIEMQTKGQKTCSSLSQIANSWALWCSCVWQSLYGFQLWRQTSVCSVAPQSSGWDQTPQDEKKSTSSGGVLVGKRSFWSCPG